MSEQGEELDCNGKCRCHVRYHLVKIPGQTTTACSRMDCGCMEYVPKPKTTLDLSVPVIPDLTAKTPS